MSSPLPSTLSPHPTSWTIPAPEAWKDVAQEIAGQLHDGDILTLSGPLGVGKTTFVQTLASALGSASTPKSPTFSMLRTYRISANGLFRMLHVDAYRIENEADMIALDLDEELAIPGTILVLEWPERVSRWLSTRKHRNLLMEIDGEGRRARLE
ncbi:MAG: tRNA (adenosine(37)-N6)-threonylcarbamoyltransferase complex ATPase subunit type 1 TsaE [Candidatus Uhrbacteria bacterium]|nr:tRNA (adenosine(37)-N6)-threonylcarbamoyltransferase complex ATPase subunit type 1 TsaE [Candidatus Uhrbacteria bacterium]